MYDDTRTVRHVFTYHFVENDRQNFYSCSFQKHGAMNKFSVDKNNTFNVKGMLACGFEILDRAWRPGVVFSSVHRQIPSKLHTYT
jgi:hypothetical protein